ncbi:beta-ketoacyl-[acyl-carrier-protein] synthase II, partial [Pseudomonas syringae]
LAPAVHLRRSPNTQLLLAAALQIEEGSSEAIPRCGAGRIGVINGTSTSSIDEASESMAGWLRERTFPDDYAYRQQELGAPANFLAAWLQLSGPAYAIATACTSSPRALPSAVRAPYMGLCDAVLCGGVDPLVRLALQAVSALRPNSPH